MPVFLTPEEFAALEPFEKAYPEWILEPPGTSDIVLESLQKKGLLVADTRFYTISNDGSGSDLGPADYPPRTYRLVVPAGRDALAALKQAANDMAKEDAKQKAKEERDRAQQVDDSKKKNHHDWLVALVSATCGSILTLLIEHFQEILVILTNLFH